MISLRHGTRSVVAGGVFAAIAAGIAPFATAQETTLRVVLAWPRTELVVEDFLKYVDEVNATGKGVVQIKILGGPEIANPRELPVGLRRGQFELIYCPTAYYLGLFPEGDMMFGYKTPMQRRANGHLAEMDRAMRQKLEATIVAHFAGAYGVNLWLTKEPKRTATGQIDLSGLKVRTSPAYRDFVIALGGTPVVLPGTAEVYTALERGTVDGTGLPVAQVRDTKIERFVKYGIEPDFLKTVILLTGNAKAIDGLPQKAKDIVLGLGKKYEETSYQNAIKHTDAEREALKKAGVKMVQLEGATARSYVDIFVNSAWERVAKNDKIVLDKAKMRALAY
jgi:TRAP-type C4-dicarboxylate transport system substrate-binding protein